MFYKCTYYRIYRTGLERETQCGGLSIWPISYLYFLQTLAPCDKYEYRDRINKKIEGLTKEIKDLQESRAKADEERESPYAQNHKLNSDNKYVTRQDQIMTKVI